MVPLRNSMLVLFLFSLLLALTGSNRSVSYAFHLTPPFRPSQNDGNSYLKNQQIDCDITVSPENLLDSSRFLADWDKKFSSNNTLQNAINFDSTNITRSLLVNAVMVLNRKATEERTIDATCGRCMLGICASSSTEGIAALKSWVTNLELPRGLLHGMDIDGVPVEFNGGVYIKYNSGGVYTFADIRKSQMGFNALWKPGDAMLEEYDGAYRGVYFQVELSDGEFRQYLLPINLFD